MLGSFRLLADQVEGVEIKEFHTNLWFPRARNLYLDVGLWFNLSQDLFFGNDNFTFMLDSPFPIKGSLVHLYDKMCNNQILQLLFNEDLNQGTVTIGQNISHFVQFHNQLKGGFLVLKPELEKINDNSIRIGLNRSELTQPVLIRGGFLQENDANRKIGVYIRFRYEVKINKESNIDITDIGFHKKVLIDLRVNDIRSAEAGSANTRLVEINSFMFFIILPSTFEIEASQAYRYGRMLEQKWSSYIGHKPTNQLLVYYWKQKDLKSDSFNLLIGAKQEKDSFRALLKALVLLAALACLIYIGDKLDLVTILGRVASIFQTIVIWIVWIISGIVVLIIGNALWDLIKYLYSIIRTSVTSWFNK